jgi:hypothetical protein
VCNKVEWQNGNFCVNKESEDISLTCQSPVKEGQTATTTSL